VLQSPRLGDRNSTGSPGVSLIGWGNELLAGQGRDLYPMAQGRRMRALLLIGSVDPARVAWREAAEDLEDGVFFMRGRGVCIATALLLCRCELLPEPRLTPELSRAAKRLRLE